MPFDYEEYNAVKYASDKCRVYMIVFLMLE